MDSILISIKKLLGIEQDYRYFDPDLIMLINSAFATLTQLGVGPEAGFSIADDKTTWDDYIATSDPLKLQLQSIKEYIYIKVRLTFDPPTIGTVMEAYNRTLKELEWRINVTVDPKTE